MAEPVVSIIIPHKDIPDLLMRCLKSIPVSEDIQVIVVDDNSPDAETYLDRYPELSRPYLEFIRTTKGGGAGYARNIGLDHAKGKWILFADADDFFIEDMYDIILSYVDSEADVIYFKKKSVLSDDISVEIERSFYVNKNIDQYLADGDEWPIRTKMPVPWGKMIKRNLIVKYNIRFDEIICFEDNYFSLLIGYYADIIKVVNSLLYIVTARPHSLMATLWENPEGLKIKAEVAFRSDKFMLQHHVCRERFTRWYLLRMFSKDQPLFKYYFLNKIDEIYPSKSSALRDISKGQSLKFKIKLYLYSLQVLLNNQMDIEKYNIFPRSFDLDSFWNRFLNKCKHYVHLFLLDHFPKVIISRRWKREMGYSLDWKHPRDINEKIQWLLVYGDTSEWTRLADKYKVREYVKEKGLEHLLVPLYGVWDDTKQIDFDALPEKFVLKCNHDYGSTILVDKNSADYNRKDICEKLDNCMKKDFGYKGELHYRGIPRKIIAEKYLEMCDSDKALSSSIIDYKVWCFNGEPCSIITMYDRTKDSLINEAYDLDWNAHPEYLVPSRHCWIGNGKIPKPKSFSEMMEASSILSKGFPEVRVDFYEIDGRLFFGEMTFTSGEGMMKQYTPEYRKFLGDQVILPKRKR